MAWRFRCLRRSLLLLGDELVAAAEAGLGAVASCFCSTFGARLLGRELLLALLLIFLGQVHVHLVRIHDAGKILRGAEKHEEGTVDRVLR